MRESTSGYLTIIAYGKAKTSSIVFFLQQSVLHRSILFSLIVSGKPTRAVPATRWFQRVTDARHPFKITLVAMDTGVGFVVWGCMEASSRRGDRHDANGKRHV
jgi:hypothetical protein